MNDDITDDLIDRYLAAEATPGECAVVEAWIAADPGRAAILQQARTSLAGSPPDFDTEGAWARLQRRLERDPKVGETMRKVAATTRTPDRFAGQNVSAVTRTRARFTGWNVAALLAGLLFAGTSVWRLVSRQTAGDALAPATLVTLAGQRDTADLADGTTIILAPATTLEVDADFGRGSRHVRLDGEAFFRVAHDARRPFRVDAAGSRVEVLGTRFGVRSRAAGVAVAVEDGRVSFAPAGEPSAAVTLSAGQVGRLAAGEERPVVDSGSTSLLAWLDDVLEFDDAPLREVAAEIERWFGVRIRIADGSLASRRVEGRFNATSVDHVLDALSLALGTAIERTDSAIVIRAGGGR